MSDPEEIISPEEDQEDYLGYIDPEAIEAIPENGAVNLQIKRWHGPLSDIVFETNPYGAFTAMRAEIPAPRPIQISNLYTSEAVMQEHADAMDLFLATARGDRTVGDATVALNFMTLAHYRDIFRDHAKSIRETAAESRLLAEVGPQNDRAFALVETGAAMLDEIARRVETRILDIVGPAALAAVKATGEAKYRN